MVDFSSRSFYNGRHLCRGACLGRRPSITSSHLTALSASGDLRRQPVRGQRTIRCRHSADNNPLRSDRHKPPYPAMGRAGAPWGRGNLVPIRAQRRPGSPFLRPVLGRHSEPQPSTPERRGLAAKKIRWVPCPEPTCQWHVKGRVAVAVRETRGRQKRGEGWESIKRRRDLG